ncbi:MAG: hypothetical protein ACOC70_01625 [bacterium]
MPRPRKRGARLRKQSTSTLLVDIGTESRVTTYRLAELADHYGLDLGSGQYLQAIQVDAQRDAAAAQSPWIDEEDPTRAPWIAFLSAQAPDVDSLREMERAGRFYFTRPDWAEREGQAKEAAGTGGNPRQARALFEALREPFKATLSYHLRRFLDYPRQEAKLLAGDREADGSVLTVVVTYSLVGGFGPGLLHAVIEEIKRTAARLSVNVKIITIGLALGTIEPPNPPQAALNQEAFLRYTAADLVADLDYAAGDHEPAPPVAESHLLVTNQNAHGEIPSLDRLQAMVAAFKFHLAFSPVGRLLHERTIDLEETDRTDAWGGPCTLSTVGMATLHLDEEKLLAWAAHTAAGLFCDRLLADPDPAPIRKEVLRTVRQTGLLETPEEPLASTRVARLEALGGADLFERLRAVFESRLEGLEGFALCQAAPPAYRFCRDRELAQNLLPAVREGCRHLQQDIVTTVRERIGTLMQEIDGPGRARRTLQDLLALADRSAETSGETARAQAESLRPVRETLGDTEEQIEALARRSGWVRFLRPFTIDRLARTYRSAAETGLRGEAELALREALDRHLFRPLRAALRQELAMVDGLIARLEALRDRAAAGLQGLAAAPAHRLTPVGLELATNRFCQRRTDGFITDLGGPEKLTRHLFDALLASTGSLTGLAEGDLEATEERVLPLCRAPFEPFAEAMDVLTVFGEEFPDRATQRDLVEQLIHEAAGRLQVTGEAGRVVPWLKIAGVGSPEAGEVASALLKDADGFPGEWVTADHGDRCTLVLVMYRAGIAVAGLLENLRRRRALMAPRPLTTESGADPIISLLPSIRASEVELRRTIVRGLVAGTLRRVDQLASSTDPTTGDVLLGVDGQEGQGFLARDFGARTRLTVDFVRAVGRRRQEVLAELATLEQKLARGEDRLRELIDHQAVATVRAEADKLWPYLKRLPKPGAQR